MARSANAMKKVFGERMTTSTGSTSCQRGRAGKQKKKEQVTRPLVRLIQLLKKEILRLLKVGVTIIIEERNDPFSDGERHQHGKGYFLFFSGGANSDKCGLVST